MFDNIPKELWPLIVIVCTSSAYFIRDRMSASAKRAQAEIDLDIAQGNISIQAQKLIIDDIRYLRQMIDDANSANALLKQQQDKSVAQIQELQSKASTLAEREELLNKMVADVQEELKLCRDERNALLNPSVP